MLEPRSVPTLRQTGALAAVKITPPRGGLLTAALPGLRNGRGGRGVAGMRKDLIIPAAFWTVTYNGARFPGAPGVKGLTGGANCQQFAYELLRHNGFAISDLRSSELWDDTADTVRAMPPFQPGDLLLFNGKPEAWGAHVAVSLGGGEAIHLAKHAGKPAVWTLEQFAARPLYTCFIGAKRPIRRVTAARLS